MAKKLMLGLGITALCALCGNHSYAQQQRHHHNWDDVDRTSAINVDSTTKGKYTLIFVNEDATFSKETEQKMTDAFFKVYPEEAKEYNPDTKKKVIIVIDTAYKGVAATAGIVVRVNPKWMHDHPEDVDVVTHEVMHIVQSYHGNAGPGWITEGIADFVRNQFGVNNKVAEWSLTPFNSKQSYTNAYRITARFFVWIQKKHDKTFVCELDAAMRSHTYTNDFWKNKTGKTVDELWAEYARNPMI
ncbi:MAG: basic secretory protein-like protein [Arachidicoccus sp.]|nr:basic secretory protein-like protein [Arachidicoccus sp.]